MNNEIENNKNRKEEILAKSRQASIDEGAEYAEMKSFRTGVIVAFPLVGIPLIIFSLVTGQTSTIFALVTLSFAFDAVSSFMAYRFTKQKIKLVLTVLSIVGTVIFAFLYVSSVLGWRG